MHPIPRLLLPALFLIVVAAGDASAQSLFRPFHIIAGYPTALAKARDTLAADAQLAFAGALGAYDLIVQGIPLRINYYQDAEDVAEAGMADAWGYVFYSPSRGRSVNLVVINSFAVGGFYSTGVDFDFPLPAQLTDLLDLNVNGAQSDSVIARVKRNSVYASYHAQYQLKQPNFVTLGMQLPSDIVKPPDFEMNGPTWAMTFSPGRDTLGLLCFVSSATGATSCQLTEPAASPSESAATSSIAMRALPNPASRTVRIALADEARPRGEVSMQLLDSRGARVLDLIPSLRDNGLRYADADVSALAPGVYFCRITIDGASSVLAVSIAR